MIRLIRYRDVSYQFQTRQAQIMSGSDPTTREGQVSGSQPASFRGLAGKFAFLSTLGTASHAKGVAKGPSQPSQPSQRSGLLGVLFRSRGLAGAGNASQKANPTKRPGAPGSLRPQLAGPEVPRPPSRPNSDSALVLPPPEPVPCLHPDGLRPSASERAFVRRQRPGRSSETPDSDAAFDKDAIVEFLKAHDYGRGSNSVGDALVRELRPAADALAAGYDLKALKDALVARQEKNGSSARDLAASKLSPGKGSVPAKGSRRRHRRLSRPTTPARAGGAWESGGAAGQAVAENLVPPNDKMPATAEAPATDPCPPHSSETFVASGQLFECSMEHLPGRESMQYAADRYAPVKAMDQHAARRPMAEPASSEDASADPATVRAGKNLYQKFKATSRLVLKLGMRAPKEPEVEEPNAPPTPPPEPDGSEPRTPSDITIPSTSSKSSVSEERDLGDWYPEPWPTPPESPTIDGPLFGTPMSRKGSWTGATALTLGLGLPPGMLDTENE